MSLIGFAIAAVITWHLANRALDRWDRRRASRRPGFDSTLRRGRRRPF